MSQQQPLSAPSHLTWRYLPNGGGSGPRGFDITYNINDGADVSVTPNTASLNLGAEK